MEVHVVLLMILIKNYYLCLGRILTALLKEIYNIFCTIKTAIELWNALEKKYENEDVGLRIFSAEKFLNFQMVDNKSKMDQVHEFKNIVNELRLKGVEINETLLV